MTIKLLPNEYEEIKVEEVRWYKDKDIKESIKTFLQGAVYCWSKNNYGQYFSLSDLMGGVNNNWKGTPLQKLYDHQSEILKKSNEDTNDAAGKAAGRLLKEMLYKDERTYISKNKKWQGAEYKWDGK